MTGLTASTPTLGWHPSDFALKGTDGRRYRLVDVRGAKGTLVMLICNHCPYVQAVLGDIIRDVRELKEHDIGAIGIMPNDVAAYPADSLENMKRLAETKQLPFPYVIDRTQELARAFGAVCTPDFFGFNADLELQYRGRIYAARNLQRVPGSGRELFDAMAQIARTSRGPAQQSPKHGMLHQVAGLGVHKAIEKAATIARALMACLYLQATLCRKSDGGRRNS